MARYVSTKSVGGGSGGGGEGAGLTETDICNQICKLSTDATGTPGSTVAESLGTQQTEISGGFGRWKMICNCPCWTSCYVGSSGGCVVWCFDTTKYRGFKLVYTGIRLCACCYAYWCNLIGSNCCYCCCNDAYQGSCVCCYPSKSCCCWDAYNCCNMLRNNCVFCCNSQYDDLWGFEWTVWAPCDAWGCLRQGRGVMWDWKYKKYIRSSWDGYHYQSRDRQAGYTNCHCMVWSPCQNSEDGRYFTRLLMKMESHPFMSALYAGSYHSGSGGACSAGQPCWTIWGIPCHRPEFGTCCMSTT